MKNSILIFRKQRIFQEFCTVFFSFTYFSWLVSELGKNLVHFRKHAFSSQHFYMYKELIKLNLDEIAFSTYLESNYCRYTWESHLFFSKILLPMELISISRNFYYLSSSKLVILGSSSARIWTLDAKPQKLSEAIKEPKYHNIKALLFHFSHWNERELWINDRVYP